VSQTRRQFLKTGLAAAAAASVPVRLGAQTPQPRISCFYQVNGEALNYYLEPGVGLPNDPGHIHVFANSHPAANPASASLAAHIHSGGASFRYAPSFDLNDHQGYLDASDAQLAEWAHTFRDIAIAANADYFAFNELPQDSGSNVRRRVQIMKLLQFLHEPDSTGRQLSGIFFMTHRPSMPANWTSRASAFWARVDATCRLVVAEHYHGHGYICGLSEADLGRHLFALRRWLAASGEPAKIRIANSKFTVLHSSHYGQLPSGWQGADPDDVTIGEFRRNLSKCAKVTRNTAGGFNRISFGPLNPTDVRVHTRIRRLINWHYNQDRGDRERLCLAASQANCEC
jgi:hypothetical protein